MIAIVNVSPEPEYGQVNRYQVRINERVIAHFNCMRSIGGASDCLRAAADAIDRDEQINYLDALRSAR